MADYFTPTVIQPAIPAADITPLERLLLSHIFHARPDGDALYFCADEGPADTIWLDRPRSQPRSPNPKHREHCRDRSIAACGARSNASIARNLSWSAGPRSVNHRAPEITSTSAFLQLSMIPCESRFESNTGVSQRCERCLFDSSLKANTEFGSWCLRSSGHTCRGTAFSTLTGSGSTPQYSGPPLPTHHCRFTRTAPSGSTTNIMSFDVDAANG